MIHTDDIILRFSRDHIRGILIQRENGEILYQDEHAAGILQGAPLWKVACPPPRADQINEVWDLPGAGGTKTYMVITSSFAEDGGLLQIHQLIDVSHYMALYRDINDYSRGLREEKERDGLTGLYNKGKFMTLKRTLFQRLDSIAVYNMDVNFLKRTNDALGHEAGDLLIKKAAESLRRIESRNVLAFRVGGDEFILAALHFTQEQAEALRRQWEEGLEEINRRQDGVPCVIACGMAWGERGCDLDALLAQADERMYADKKAIKARAGLAADER